MFGLEKRRIERTLAAPIDARRTAASSRRATIPMLEALASDPSEPVRLAVAGNAIVDADLLHRLAHDSAASVREVATAEMLSRAGYNQAQEALEDPNAPPPVLGAVAEGLGWLDLRKLCGTDNLWLRDHPHMEPRQPVLVELSHAHASSVRCEVAKSRWTPTAARMALATDPEEAVKLAVAQCAFTEPEVLARCCQDPSAEVRKHVALSERADSALLATLSRDPESSVRVAAVRNAATSSELLVELTSDPEVEVRVAVALRYGKTATRGLRPQKAVPAAPVAALLRLVDDVSPEVRRAVAGNPALPPSAFLRLANDPESAVRKYVAQVVAYGYRQPTGEYASSRYATDDRKSDFDPTLLEALAQCADPAIRSAVAQHHLVPVKVLARLLDDPFVFERKSSHNPSEFLFDEQTDPPAQIDHHRLPPHLTIANFDFKRAGDWLTIAGVKNPEARRAVAWQHNAAPEALARLAKDAEPAVRLAVAHNLGLPAPAARGLIDDADSSVAAAARALFIDRPGRFADGFALFLDVESVEVRLAVANSSAASASVLAALARDSSPNVRAVVASKSSTSSELLTTLAWDEDPEVTSAVADGVRRGRFASDTLTALSTSPSALVRAAVAIDMNVPEDALRALVDDPDEAVRVAAAASGYNPMSDFISAVAMDSRRKLGKELGIGQSNVPKLVAIAADSKTSSRALHALGQSPFDDVRAAAARNAAVGAATLANLARDPEPQVRVSVAENPNTSAQVLAALSGDGDVEVRRQVAYNPNTAPGVINSFTDHTDPELALAVALHPEVTASTLAALIAVHSEPQPNQANLRVRAVLGGESPMLRALQPWRNEVWEHLNRSDRVWQQGVRQAVAAHPLAPRATLDDLSRHSDTAALVAGNPNTDAETLSELTRSHDPRTREAVARRDDARPEDLAALSVDHDQSVRLAVARNPQTPRTTLEILSEDFSVPVKDAARLAIRDVQ